MTLIVGQLNYENITYKQMGIPLGGLLALVIILVILIFLAALSIAVVTVKVNFCSTC